MLIYKGIKNEGRYFYSKIVLISLYSFFVKENKYSDSKNYLVLFARFSGSKWGYLGVKNIKKLLCSISKIQYRIKTTEYPAKDLPLAILFY